MNINERLPWCVSKGTYLDGPRGLRPWCIKEECPNRDRCRAVIESDEQAEMGGMPGRMEGGKPRG